MQEPIDLAKGAASFASAPVGALPDRRADHGARARVPSARDQRHRAGDLRRRVDRVPRALARHERGEDGQERARRFPCRSRRRSGAGAAPAGDDPFGDAEVAAAPAGQPRIRSPRRTRRPRQPSEFSDAVAIQIPSEAPTGARKPYFLFGDGQNPVDLWFFDLASPSRCSSPARAARDITAEGPADVTGVASYDQGEWSVIFKRPLRPASARAVPPGEFTAVAFSVWDGFARERGNKRGLTLWYSLYVEPAERPVGRRPDGPDRALHARVELA